MAQQLATLRTAAAYAGVTAYAHSHTGEAAAAAYLALGHAYLLDHRYSEAETSFRAALTQDGELGDYSDYLDAEASHAAGDDAAAEKLLRGFGTRYPDSVFTDQAPVLEANVLLALKDPTGCGKSPQCGSWNRRRCHPGLSPRRRAGGSRARPARLGREFAETTSALTTPYFRGRNGEAEAD